MGGKPAPTVPNAIAALERTRAKLREVYAAFIRIGHPEAVATAECAEEALEIVNAAAAHAAKVPSITTKVQGKRARLPKGTIVRVQERYVLLYACGLVPLKVVKDEGKEVLCETESREIYVSRSHLKEEKS